MLLPSTRPWRAPPSTFPRSMRWVPTWPAGRERTGGRCSAPWSTRRGLSRRPWRDRRGPLRFRVIPPAGPPRGVFLHIHGGGWVLGGAHHHDPMLERLADATRLTVVSTYYRLAPENPYPAGPDDCEAAALWLHENALRGLGAEPVAIGGESAGAHLAAVTCLRLRDRHGLNPFRAALLTYGAYDLRGTPSVRAAGEKTLILTTSVIRWFTEQFAAGHDLTDPRPVTDLCRPGPNASRAVHRGDRRSPIR